MAMAQPKTLAPPHTSTRGALTCPHGAPGFCFPGFAGQMNLLLAKSCRLEVFELSPEGLVVSAPLPPLHVPPPCSRSGVSAPDLSALFACGGALLPSPASALELPTVAVRCTSVLNVFVVVRTPVAAFRAPGTIS